MSDDATPAKVRLTDGLGPADDIRDNARVMIYRWPNCTKLHLAKNFPGCFAGYPDMVWSRRLSDDETKAMLENPWRVFDRLEPGDRVMIPTEPNAEVWGGAPTGAASRTTAVLDGKE